MLSSWQRPLSYWLNSHFRARLYAGSIGAEFWSSIILLFHILGLFLKGSSGYTLIDILILRLAPVAPSVVGAACLAHFTLLWLPNSRVTIIMRKLYSALELAFWVEIGMEAWILGYPGIGISLIVQAVLLVFSILRRDYRLWGFHMQS